MNPYQCGFCGEDGMHAQGCSMLQGRCQWCGIALTWWERLLGFFYLGNCGTCRAALGRDDPSPPMPYQSRYWFCRRYLADHRDYSAGHHSEAYP